MFAIPFNKPFISGNEIAYITQAIQSGKISGNGLFTNKCQTFFEQKYGFRKCLLTTSCTDALEMAALLAGIGNEDEVIVPSYTFVSTANAFLLRGAKVVFCDSSENSPHLDVTRVERLINKRTKAIVVMHYGGIPCDMDPLMALAEKYNLYVIEDAALAIGSLYKKKPAGLFGHFSCFSFHETKNITSGEGGLLVVNDERFIRRAETIWEKGTNRTAFTRGEVDQYDWIDLGSSFLPSEITAAFLFAQLEAIEETRKKSMYIWNEYYNLLKPLDVSGKLRLPAIPSYAGQNFSTFYFLCTDHESRNQLLHFLKENHIEGAFHYLPLHKSPYYTANIDCISLPNAEMFAEQLIRLPVYYDLKDDEICNITGKVWDFFN